MFWSVISTPTIFQHAPKTSKVSSVAHKLKWRIPKPRLLILPACEVLNLTLQTWVSRKAPRLFPNLHFLGPWSRPRRSSMRRLFPRALKKTSVGTVCCGFGFEGFVPAFVSMALRRMEEDQSQGSTINSAVAQTTASDQILKDRPRGFPKCARALSPPGAVVFDQGLGLRLSDLPPVLSLANSLQTLANNNATEPLHLCVPTEFRSLPGRLASKLKKTSGRIWHCTFKEANIRDPEPEIQGLRPDILTLPC